MNVLRLLRRIFADPTLPVVLAAYGAWGAWRATRSYRSLPIVPAADGGHVAPLTAQQGGEGRRNGGVKGAAAPGATVSVVIPARDEAHNLGNLLSSLQAIAGDQERGFLDAVVVDDASTDGTGDLARRAQVPSLSVVRLEEADKPGGWVGKTNACQVGAAATAGEWLLFLDADVTLGPEAIAGALAFAHAHGLDAFSMFLRQRCETLWERLLLPYAFQQFFAGVDPRRMRDPLSDEAVFNGQFILIRRAVYDAIGGHYLVRADVAEDVAIARVLKARGYRIDVGRGEALADVRMYRSFASIRRGFGKNAYAILADEPVRGIQVAAASTGAGMTLPLLGMAALASGRTRTALALAGAVSWATQAVLMRPWLRAFVVPNGDAFLHPVSALAFQVIGMESMVRSVGRLGVSWKGRRYIDVSTRGETPLHPQIPLPSSIHRRDG